MTPEQQARLVVLRDQLEKAETALREGRPNLALNFVASALAHVAEFEKSEHAGTRAQLSP